MLLTATILALSYFRALEHVPTTLVLVPKMNVADEMVAGLPLPTPQLASLEPSPALIESSISNVSERGKYQTPHRSRRAALY